MDAKPAVGAAAWCHLLFNVCLVCVSGVRGAPRPRRGGRRWVRGVRTMWWGGALPTGGLVGRVGGGVTRGRPCGELRACVPASACGVARRGDSDLGGPP